MSCACCARAQPPATRPVAGREHAVGDDEVDAVAVERERGERAPRLGGHHRLRREHEPHRRDRRIAEQLPHAGELVVEAQQRLEQVVGRDHLAAAEQRRDRTDALGDAPMRRKHLLQVPAERLGQREQPQRLGGRRAVDDQRVPVAGEREFAHREQGEDLVDAGQHGQLVRGDRVDAAAREHVDEEALHVAPGGFEPALRVDLHRPQRRRHLGRFARERDVEGIGERVRDVGRQQQRLQAAVGEPQRRRRRRVVLPTPPLPVNRMILIRYRRLDAFLQLAQRLSMTTRSALRLSWPSIGMRDRR